MTYIVIFDNQNLSNQLFDSNTECSPLCIEYFETVIFYKPLKAFFDICIVPLSVNSFIISSPLEEEALLNKIKTIINGRGNLHNRPLCCQIYISKVHNLKHFTLLNKESEIKLLFDYDSNYSMGALLDKEYKK
jgi:hypothetical protein